MAEHHSTFFASGNTLSWDNKFMVLIAVKSVHNFNGLIKVFRTKIPQNTSRNLRNR